MDLSESHVPCIDDSEIPSDGSLLDESFDPQPENNKDKIRCKLYYLKTRDLFVTVSGKGSYNVITFEDTIAMCRQLYLHEEYRKPLVNTVSDLDISDHAPFESKITAQYIMSHGKFLECTQGCDVYYLDEFDLFTRFDPVDRLKFHTDKDADGTLYRKKYNILHQDERLATLH
jgi:hypothetical protein